MHLQVIYSDLEIESPFQLTYLLWMVIL